MMNTVLGGALRGFARRRITPPSPRASWSRIAAASSESDDFVPGGGREGSSADFHIDQQGATSRAPQEAETSSTAHGNGNGNGNGNGSGNGNGELKLKSSGNGSSRVWSKEQQLADDGSTKAGSSGVSAAFLTTTPREPLMASPRKPAPAWVSLTKYYVAFMVVGASANSFGPMLPQIAQRVGIATVDVGPLVQAGAVGGLLGSALCPLLPLRALIPGGLLGLSASLVAVPHAASLTGARSRSRSHHTPARYMALALASASVCFQAVSVGAHTFVAREAGPGSAGLHINGINALFGAGSFVAPALHEALAPHLPVWFGNTLASYWVVAAGAGAASLPFLFGATRGYFKDRSASAFAAAAAAAKLGGAAPASAAAGSTFPSATAAAAAPVLPAGTVKLNDAAVPLFLTMILVASVAGYEACYAAWLFTFCREGPLHLASAAAAGSVSLFWAALTAGRVAAAGAAAKLPPHAVLLCSLPLAVLGPVAIVAMPGSSVGLSLGLVACGLGISAGFANSVSLLARVTPVSPTTQSLMQLSAAGGALTIAPFMLTLAKGDLGPMALPLVTGTFAAAAIALVVGTHASSSHVLRGFKKKAAADDIGGV